jgi:hypothetical protein
MKKSNSKLNKVKIGIFVLQKLIDKQPSLDVGKTKISQFDFQVPHQVVY